MKNQRMIIATITEYGTDEDSELASRVLRSLSDSFLTRPSVDDQPMRMISVMANNDIVMMRDELDSTQCDAAVVFLDRRRARFLISGVSAAYHFEDGKLAHRSKPEESSILGFSAHYEPDVQPVFELKPCKNAFLTVSRSLATALSDQELEEALNASSSPEDWIHRIEALAGPDKAFCAVAAFLPEAKPSLLNLILRK